VKGRIRGRALDEGVGREKNLGKGGGAKKTNWRHSRVGKIGKGRKRKGENALL